MESARQPAAALRDRAERHVFAAVPDLPAHERRVLAMLELAGDDRAGVAADTGLGEQAVGATAARARKALRRARRPLAAGGRCEHAERLLSDRLDGLGAREGRRWLEIHLGRCGRCREHETLLEEQRRALRTAFEAAERTVVAPGAVEPGPTAPELPPPTDGPGEQLGPGPDRVRLRVVPDVRALPPGREPSALDAPPAPPDLEPAEPLPPADSTGPVRAAGTAEPAPVAAPAAGPGRAAARVVAAIALLAALVAGGILGARALDRHPPAPRAPWAAPDAPNVRPEPLDRQ